jgi:hypothetical protein
MRLPAGFEKNEIAVSEITAVAGISGCQALIECLDTEHEGSLLGAPALGTDLYAGAMTLIENNDNLLPLGRLDRMRIATVSVNRLAMTEFQKMTDRYTNADHYFIDPSNEQGARFVISKLKDYDVVIAGFCSLEQKPAGSTGVTPALNSVFRQIAALDRAAVIWFGNPTALPGLI